MMCLKPSHTLDTHCALAAVLYHRAHISETHLSTCGEFCAGIVPQEGPCVFGLPLVAHEMVTEWSCKPRVSEAKYCIKLLQMHAEAPVKLLCCQKLVSQLVFVA